MFDMFVLIVCLSRCEPMINSPRDFDRYISNAHCSWMNEWLLCRLYIWRECSYEDENIHTPFFYLCYEVRYVNITPIMEEGKLKRPNRQRRDDALWSLSPSIQARTLSASKAVARCNTKNSMNIQGNGWSPERQPKLLWWAWCPEHQKLTPTTSSSCTDCPQLQLCL